MTLQQLKYAVEIDKCGSLSKAAKKLFVSQPNLSNAIKDLETEYGITIFKRNNRGVQITEKGATFLIYARSVLKQCEEMKHISSDDSSTSFKLIAQNYSPIMESFVKFVKTNSDKEKINFELINAKSFEVIDHVYKQDADLGVILIEDDKLIDFKEHLKDRNLNFIPLGTLPFYIKLRKGHPLLKNKDSIFQEIHKYPFVQFRERSYDQTESLMFKESFDFINRNKEIFVFDREVKFRLVDETDAYGIGCKLHPNLAKLYDWVKIPIPNFYAQIGYIHSGSRSLSVEAQLYVDILIDELKGLVLL